MVVCHIIIGLDVGGAELALRRLVVDHSSRFSCQHIIFSLTGVGKIGSELIKLNYDVYHLGMNGVAQLPVTLARLFVLIKKIQPDIVQTWMYHSDLLGGLAARLAGIDRVIWGVRSTDIRQGGSRATLFIRKLCALLSHIVPSKIVCAANASRIVHEGVGYAPEKMVVIPNGYDLAKLIATSDDVHAIRQACGLLPNDRVIGSVGRFSPVKNHALFIASANRLLSIHPNVKFLLVGRGLDQTNPEIMRLIQGTQRPGAFVLLGERSDVASCFKAMDIFCLHSSTEGFPNVLGEAMAMGLPCVTTDVGDAAFLLDRYGLVVPSKDPDALANALDNLLRRDTSELKSMGEAAKLRIYSEFSMKAMTDRFHQLYLQLVSRSS